jgi:large subunit ribosomal protein L3
MVKALVGKKIGMTQVFDEAGTVVPVTVLELGPCQVIQVKHDATGACKAVQIGFEERKKKNTPKPLLGHFEKANATPKKLLRDVEVEEGAKVEPGQNLSVSVFAETPLVDIIGLTKGRGFQGVMKRHGFAGGPASHGSKTHRHPGTIGPSSMPGQVIKGRHMGGHMGCERVTVKNLAVVKIDEANNLLMVKGAVPGNKGSYVMVRKAHPGRKQKAQQ